MSLLGCAGVLSVKSLAIVLLQALESVGLHMHSTLMPEHAVQLLPRGQHLSRDMHVTRDIQQAVCTSMNHSS